jgi:hypothetical protein
MRARPLLLVVAAVVVAGCESPPSGAATARKPWDACAFYQPMDGATAFGAGAADPGDISWPAKPGLGAAAYVAESRCDFSARADAATEATTTAGAPGVTVVARLSLLQDRTLLGQEELLAEEGFQDLRLASSDADGSPQLLAFVPTTSADGRTVAGRAEIHQFLTISCGGADAQATAFFEYLVLAFSNFDQTADELIARLRAAADQTAEAARLAGLQIVSRAGVGCAAAPADGGARDGSTDSGADAPIGSALSLSQLAPALADAYCGRMADCCASGAAVTPATDCGSSVGETLGVLLQQASLSASRGTLDYAPEAGAACVAHLRSASCAELANILPAVPCLDTLMARQPQGASCFSPFDCEAGGFCSAGEAADGGVDAGDGGPPTGTCAATAGLGAPCSSDVMCASGNCSTAGHVCTDSHPTGTCAPH